MKEIMLVESILVEGGSILSFYSMEEIAVGDVVAADGVRYRILEFLAPNGLGEDAYLRRAKAERL